MRFVVPVLLVTLLSLFLTAVGLTIWLVLRARLSNGYDIIHLDGPGVGTASQDFAYTRIRKHSYMFWWYFESEAPIAAERPIVVWLDGLVGEAPSVQANFLGLGPYDFDLNERNDSLVKDLNLLLIDAPIGQGFSYSDREAAFSSTPEENANDIVKTLHAFFERQPQLRSTELYIFGQGYGGRMAVEVAQALLEALSDGYIECNFKGIALGNAMISPLETLSDLDDYLWELGYVEERGRDIVQAKVEEIQSSSGEDVLRGLLELEELIQNVNGAVAINTNYLIDKSYNDTRILSEQIRSTNVNAQFMDNRVAPALGIHNVMYDSQKATGFEGLLPDIMTSVAGKIEQILNETDLDVWIYNGNFDALSHPRGIMQWFEGMSWNDKNAFLASPRLPFAVNGYLGGHIRSYNKLRYVWIKTAGVNVPQDNPEAFREILRRITQFQTM